MHTSEKVEVKVQDINRSVLSRSWVMSKVGKRRQKIKAKREGVDLRRQGSECDQGVLYETSK